MHGSRVHDEVRYDWEEAGLYVPALLAVPPIERPLL